jgi:molybdenum cofactor cytidylyltransferase
MGENKLLADVRGKTMIRGVVEACLQSKADLVVVVLGHEEQAVRGALEGLQCRLVVNENYESGQSSSLKKGLAEVQGEVDAILVTPGDIALMSPRFMNSVIEEYLERDGKIVVASHRGRSGHPILIDGSLFDEVARVDEASFGLKAVVNAHFSEVRRVEVDSRDVLLDVDTKNDYERFVLGKET